MADGFQWIRAAIDFRRMILLAIANRRVVVVAEDNKLFVEFSTGHMMQFQRMYVGRVAQYAVRRFIPQSLASLSAAGFFVAMIEGAFAFAHFVQSTAQTTIRYISSKLLPPACESRYRKLGRVSNG